MLWSCVLSDVKVAYNISHSNVISSTTTKIPSKRWSIGHSNLDTINRAKINTDTQTLSIPSKEHSERAPFATALWVAMLHRPMKMFFLMSVSPWDKWKSNFTWPVGHEILVQVCTQRHFAIRNMTFLYKFRTKSPCSKTPLEWTFHTWGLGGLWSTRNTSPRPR